MSISTLECVAGGLVLLGAVWVVGANYNKTQTSNTPSQTNLTTPNNVGTSTNSGAGNSYTNVGKVDILNANGTTTQTNVDGSVTVFGQAQTLASQESAVTTGLGAGTLTNPYKPSTSGLLTYNGLGYYQTTIPNVMGTSAGVYLVNNQAFVTNYDANAGILGY